MSSRLFSNFTLAAVLAICSAETHAAGFAAGVSPSKFELRAEPGTVLRDTIAIVNPGTDPADFELKTADWRLSETGSVEFIEDTLLEGSCRPWVRLERRTLRIEPGSQRNYRFEVHVPDDAPAGLCRFAIVIEPAEAVMTRIGEGTSAISVPIVGRYAVVTYVTIGDASPAIELVGVGTMENNGERLPAVTLRNTGNTYDRAIGQLTAVDFRGERVLLVPMSFPVLPGRTEQIAIVPDLGLDTAERISLRFPLRMTGSIEIAGQIFEVDEVLE